MTKAINHKSRKYYIDPDHVVPEPTPANRFNMIPDPGTPGARQAAIKEAVRDWRETGVKHLRVTLTGPDIEGDDTNYPAGMWLEGWDDENARMLPFGAPWPNEDSAIWPPLTATA
jgi:hypothetical protein